MEQFCGHRKVLNYCKTVKNGVVNYINDESENTSGVNFIKTSVLKLGLLKKVHEHCFEKVTKKIGFFYVKCESRTDPNFIKSIDLDTVKNVTL